MTVTAKAGYLHIQVTGENILQTVLDYTAEIYQECHRRNCWKVLIDENLQGDPLSMIDVYHVIAKGSEMAKQPIVVAFVDENPRSARNLEFAENVAFNRGLNLRVFPDHQKAEAWIQQVSDPPTFRSKT
ncbi:MAG TPA: hypothetical protein VLR94_06940 [Acidobacteriota bacterium]|nr:hypothetical protein [Acidobacteriota bacterium]